MPHKSLYDDPDLVRRTIELRRMDRSYAEIASELKISTRTVAKIVKPGEVEASRVRGAAFDARRVDERRADPDHQAMLKRYYASEAHRGRVRADMRRRRAEAKALADEIDAMATQCPDPDPTP